MFLFPKGGQRRNFPEKRAKGKRRSADIAYPRQIAMYLSRQLTEENLNRIGLEFGGRDHSTVIHACDKIAMDIKENPMVANQIKEIQNKM